MKNQHALSIWRREKSLSQEDLAKELGISRWMVNRIETGRRKPSLSLALRVQTFTSGKVTPKDLVGQA